MQEKLGPYLIKEQIGRGGMGNVYSAHHEETEELVAVKVLSSAFASDQSFRDRFQQEIETLQQLQHKGIVQIIGFGQEDGTLFYAMELVQGRTLFEVLKENGPLSWREVTRITIEICYALKHAHDRGVIHRDLKPSNLFMSDEDEVKLVDFGIAKLFGASQLTADHAVVGTADYMAPEQAEGARPTTKSDLYSLGSVMYALLTGKPPFASPAIGQVIHKLKFDQPRPITEIIADVPLELDYIVRMLLSKQPDDRIPTPLAVAHRLQAMQHALESNMPAKTEQPTREIPDQDAVPDGATMEYVPTGHHNPVTSGRTIEGEYRSEVPSGGDQNAPTVSDPQYQTSAEEQPEPDPTHYTTVPEDRFHSDGESSSGVIASLIVLVALLAGAGGLLAFTKWYNRPPSFEELKEVIDDAASNPGKAKIAMEHITKRFKQHPEYEQVKDDYGSVNASELLDVIGDTRFTLGSDWERASKKWEQVSEQMEAFTELFSEHAEFPQVKNRYDSLKIARDEQLFLKSHEGELKEIPVVKITLLQILESEGLSPDETVTLLRHFVTLYESREGDEVAEACLDFARRKIDQLRLQQEETLLAQKEVTTKTETEIQEILDFCREATGEDVKTAIKLLEAVRAIHQHNANLSDVLEEVRILSEELSTKSK